MKVAVLADAHANLPALMAVLRDIRSQSVQEIWFLGDYVGYGPAPQKVIQVIRKQAQVSIAGNYDLNVLRFPQKQRKWKNSKTPSKYFSFKWTYRQLSKPARNYLQNLPCSVRCTREGLNILLTHGSPESMDEPLQDNTPVKRFEQLAQTSHADLILCGHTHKFFLKKIKNVWFVNPGSVGRPFDGDPRASYVVMDIDGRKISVSNRRISYPLKSVIRAMTQKKFPKDIIRSIETGQSLDEINRQVWRQASEKDVIQEVLKLARSCEYEKEHSHQVTQLTLQLFDGLADLHQLSPRHRLLLQSASLLHDIGWIKGRIRHHKTSRDMILKSYNLPLSYDEKVIVALVARYHRRALPKNTHKYYSDLSDGKKEELKKLASLLRLADGFDSRHVNSVKALRARVDKRQVVLEIRADDFSEWEKARVEKKSDLFRLVFQKELQLKITEEETV